MPPFFVDSTMFYNMSSSAKGSTCGYTINNVKRKKGKSPRLVDGIEVVPAGVQRIMELQEQGYAYIRP